MAAYNIYEAKAGFSALVDRAVNGEEVIIAKAFSCAHGMKGLHSSFPD